MKNKLKDISNNSIKHLTTKFTKINQSSQSLDFIVFLVVVLCALCVKKLVFRDAHNGVMSSG